MQFVDNFSLTRDENLNEVYNQLSVPVFQNKVYPTKDEAKSINTLNVQLVQNKISGFIFNKIFDSKKMNYDEHYQNEQAHSNYFNHHLDNVLNLLISLGITNKKVVEIGCGKGVFFNKLEEIGIDCVGFDPTYEGNHPKILKEYFTENSNINGDVVILRHTLEHIEQPFSFLHSIAKANNYKGFLFVEVPTFDWIVNKNAFWDIFYEHCNYFTEASLGCMFANCKTGSFFNGQYIYLWADMSSIYDSITPQNFILAKPGFTNQINKWQLFLQTNKQTAIWGAGAKGSTFLNLLDKNEEFVNIVVDINPAKQNKFIGGTGHKIISPSELQNYSIKNVIVMNENYLPEIKSYLQKNNLEFNLTSI